MFAGSFRGVTQTAPLAIYERFATDFTGALALSAVLVVVSAALLLAVKLLRPDALGVLRVEARTPLGALELDVALEVADGECLALAGPSGAGKTTRAADRRRAASRPSAGASPAAASLARHRARRRRAAGAAPLRLRLPGLRAVRAPERLAQRRLRAARRAARRERRARARRAARALRARRAAPTRGRATLSGGERQRVALARALARDAARAAARRAAVGARRAHARDAPRASWPACCATPACPRCSSRTTSPRRRCSATASAVIDGGRIVQLGTAARARRRAGVGVRRRLHGRRRADRRRARRAPDGLTRRRRSTAAASAAAPTRRTGRSALSVHPWEIALEPRGRAPRLGAEPPDGRGRLDHRDRQPRAGRARGRQPLVAEVTRRRGRRAAPRAAACASRRRWKADGDAARCPLVAAEARRVLLAAK